jgi:hypothetical protein
MKSSHAATAMDTTTATVAATATSITTATTRTAVPKTAARKSVHSMTLPSSSSSIAPVRLGPHTTMNNDTPHGNNTNNDNPPKEPSQPIVPQSTHGDSSTTAVALPTQLPTHTLTTAATTPTTTTMTTAANVATIIPNSTTMTMTTIATTTTTTAMTIAPPSNHHPRVGRRPKRISQKLTANSANPTIQSSNPALQAQQQSGNNNSMGVVAQSAQQRLLPSTSTSTQTQNLRNSRRTTSWEDSKIGQVQHPKKNDNDISGGGLNQNGMLGAARTTPTPPTEYHNHQSKHAMDHDFAKRARIHPLAAKNASHAGFYYQTSNHKRVATVATAAAVGVTDARNGSHKHNNTMHQTNPMNHHDTRKKRGSPTHPETPESTGRTWKRIVGQRVYAEYPINRQWYWGVVVNRTYQVNPKYRVPLYEIWFDDGDRGVDIHRRKIITEEEYRTRWQRVFGRAPPRCPPHLRDYCLYLRDKNKEDHRSNAAAVAVAVGSAAPAGAESRVEKVSSVSPAGRIQQQRRTSPKKRLHRSDDRHDATVGGEEDEEEEARFLTPRRLSLTAAAATTTTYAVGVAHNNNVNHTQASTVQVERQLSLVQLFQHRCDQCVLCTSPE